tara:strand:+ start:664 stop:795 length:132 start_codon:yes stop_codon:yes gene_type:complete
VILNGFKKHFYNAKITSAYTFTNAFGELLTLHTKRKPFYEAET